MSALLKVRLLRVMALAFGFCWLGSPLSLAQYQAYGTDSLAPYTGNWGSRFGVVGGPIVTVNGYLYPVYNPLDLTRLSPTAFVNGGPVLSDWSTGYSRLDPARFATLRSLGYNTNAWGQPRFTPPLLPLVAGPPELQQELDLSARETTPAPAPTPREPPRLILPEQPAQETKADKPPASTSEPRIIQPGDDNPTPSGPIHPHLIEIDPPH